MKQSVKPTQKRRPKRDLFAELSGGMEALADARRGKRTLRNHIIEPSQDPPSHRELIHLRKNLRNE